MIVDDVRVSRLICHVAKNFELSCLATNKSDNIKEACKKHKPDVILLDPELFEKEGKNVLRDLVQQKSAAAIVLTNTNPEQAAQMQELGDSLGLNMAGVLPDVFDAEILKREFISIFQRAGKHFAGFSNSDMDTSVSVPENKVNDFNNLNGG